MKYILFAVIGLSFSLSGCIPSVMMRDQDRLGMQGWIAGAAQKGQLPISFYGTDDKSLEQAITSVMQGQNYGPVVPLVLLPDTDKGARVVVVLDPAADVYKNYVCSHPKDGFKHDVQENTRAALAICYNDLSYGNVIATSRKGRLVPGSEDFTVFYQRAFRLLSDPQYEINEIKGSCEGVLCS
jgi:hypothetical protein